MALYGTGVFQNRIEVEYRGIQPRPAVAGKLFVKILFQDLSKITNFSNQTKKYSK
jgi:hypothetical protein